MFSTNEFIVQSPDGARKAEVVGDRLKVDAVVSNTDGEASTKRKTFVVNAVGVAIGNNKSMLSLLNAAGSGVVVRLEKMYLINTQTAGITGINADFRLFRITGHSVGTALTPLTHDTSDTLSASVTARTGSTVAGEAAAAMYRWMWGTDEWATGPADADSADHSLQNVMPLYEVGLNTKALTLRPGEGISLKQVVNSTVGTFDVILVFTEAAA